MKDRPILICGGSMGPSALASAIAMQLLVDSNKFDIQIVDDLDTVMPVAEQTPMLEPISYNAPGVLPFAFKPPLSRRDRRKLERKKCKS